MSLGIKTKAPSEVVQFTFDWTDWLDTTRDGTADDTISTSTWTVDDGITKDSDSNTTVKATATISGGTAGERYTITNTIVTTTSGETFERSAVICVENL